MKVGVEVKGKVKVGEGVKVVVKVGEGVEVGVGMGLVDKGKGKVSGSLLLP